MLSLFPFEENVDLSSYVVNGEWELNDMTAETVMFKYETSDQQYYQVIYEVRKYSFIVMLYL